MNVTFIMGPSMKWHKSAQDTGTEKPSFIELDLCARIRTDLLKNKESRIEYYGCHLILQSFLPIDLVCKHPL